MHRTKDGGRGRCSVEIELANYDDLVRAEAGDIPQGQVRRLKLRGVVDTGATRLTLPAAVAKRLGLKTEGKVGVRYADGRMAEREVGRGVHLTCIGRSSVFNAILEPQRESALIGAIVLEDLDLLVDCINRTLVPRDPRYIISELE